MRQLGDEDCILPSKLQAALQQILEEREDILSHVDADGCEGQRTADGSGVSVEPLVAARASGLSHALSSSSRSAG